MPRFHITYDVGPGADVCIALVADIERPTLREALAELFEECGTMLKYQEPSDLDISQLQPDNTTWATVALCTACDAGATCATCEICGGTGQTDTPCPTPGRIPRWCHHIPLTACTVWCVHCWRWLCPVCAAEHRRTHAPDAAGAIEADDTADIAGGTAEAVEASETLGAVEASETVKETSLPINFALLQAQRMYGICSAPECDLPIALWCVRCHAKVCSHHARVMTLTPDYRHGAICYRCEPTTGAIEDYSVLTTRRPDFDPSEQAISEAHVAWWLACCLHRYLRFLATQAPAFLLDRELELIESRLTLLTMARTSVREVAPHDRA